jgi:hypothetical protein
LYVVTAEPSSRFIHAGNEESIYLKLALLISFETELSRDDSEKILVAIELCEKRVEDNNNTIVRIF